MKKYDHPEPSELPSAAGKTSKPNPFERFRSRRRFDRAEREFLALTDQTAWQLIDRLALDSEAGITVRPTPDSTPDIDRLNALLEELKNSALPDRKLRLWVCIRRYDHLCMVSESCLSGKQVIHNTLSKRR